MVNYRDKVREYLLKEMQKGTLQPGQNINLAAVSRTIGVSVTPIREALTQLQQSHIVKAIPYRGFVIAKVSPEEAKNLYELVAHLEVLALEESQFDNKAVEQLKLQRDNIAQAETSLNRVIAYMEFHRLLTKNYNNSVFQQILKDLKTRVFFYERAFMANDSFHYNSNDQHDAIISAIEDDNIPSAALVLKMNWMMIQNYLEKQLVTL
ncbi:DNA-binding GntR family transcriptional regulator [Flavobacteriaceae bacterium MAR_2009_75]|uniref:GntR family transcriptional regulator n=1 Tax=Pseudozobellia sp. WGM2 TaxID=2787625 RepID=UPI000C2C5A22|nr:GntR family transcriptional regulator [Pseudozobellia sp. WGM2]PKA96398.1 DNA-binding GntR family transcriptional regulator [Flavobacteriaceae bacterium MAR_2009_75]